jgi:hypothetical protein
MATSIGVDPDSSLVPSRAERDVVGGLAGLCFLGGVLLQNGLLLQGNPLPSAPLEEVSAFYQAGEVSIGLAVGWVAINVPLLITFGVSVAARLEQANGSTRFARVGLCGVVLLAAAFSCTTWLQAVLVARASELQASGTLSLVWDLHTAAFSSSGSALCVAMGGFSAAAWQGDLVPRWTAVVGGLGALCLVGSGLMAVGTVTGGPGIFLQLVGFVAWVIWLLTASARLLAP